MVRRIVLNDDIKWRVRWQVEKFEGDFASDAEIREAGVEPYEVIEGEGNLLVFGGASALWDLLIGAANVAAYSNANAHIGVGDSSTAAAATQTDLQAATNKLRKAMEASYPDHTDGTADGADDIVFRSVFGTSEANFAWEEWAVFNHATTGRMLNRKVASLGTKASGSTWTFTVTLTLS